MRINVDKNWLIFRHSLPDFNVLTASKIDGKSVARTLNLLIHTSGFRLLFDIALNLIEFSDFARFSVPQYGNIKGSNRSILLTGLPL